MLDTYDFDDDVWLCHSFQGHCHDFTAFVCKIYLPTLCLSSIFLCFRKGLDSLQSTLTIR